MNHNIEATKQNLRGKTVLVVGAARAGMAAAELLLSIGTKVLLNDSKPQEALKPLPEALHTNPACTLYLGVDTESLLPLADLVVISPGIPPTAAFIIKAQALGLPVLGELGLAAALVSQQMIAISGTNGKTTTVSLLGEMLRQAGKVVHITGNIGFPLSSAVLLAKPDDVMVCEVSSFQLETSADFHPQAAALLNISPDHLDRHGSMEAYTGLKQRLFANMDASDLAVLNHDDDVVCAMVPQIKAQVHWFSLKQEVNPGAYLKEGRIWSWQGDEAVPVVALTDLKIPGLHNAQNALAATALAAGLGLPIPVITYALKHFEGVEHRIEFVKDIAGVRWLNDSKGTNPDSTQKAVAAMERPTILIAGGYDKQVHFDGLAGEIQSGAQVRDVIVLGQTAEKIASSLGKMGFEAIHHSLGLEEAVELAHELAKPGDNVLFSPACASFGMFLDYEQRGRVFKALVFALQERKQP